MQTEIEKAIELANRMQHGEGGAKWMLTQKAMLLASTLLKLAEELTLMKNRFKEAHKLKVHYCSQRAELRAQLDQGQQQLAKAEEVLQFYSEKNSYRCAEHGRVTSINCILETPVYALDNAGEKARTYFKEKK